MPSPILHDQAKGFLKRVPSILPGYTVRVHERIQEGGKERIQAFEGLVIAVHNGHVPTDATFTVRKVVSGIGVEKVFPVHAHTIEKIEVKKVAKARRAKLYFIRGRSGKAARLNERFTNEGEFDVAPEAPAAVETPVVAEVPAEEVKVEEAAAEAPAEVVAEAPVAEEAKSDEQASA